MSWGRRLTLAGLGVAGAALLYVEARALKSKESGDTISAVSAGAIRDYPVLAGLGTATLVHFCTPTREPNEPLPWWQRAPLALAAGALLGLSWIRYDKRRRSK